MKTIKLLIALLLMGIMNTYGQHDHSKDHKPENMAQHEQQIYTCPMHPEVTSNSPGSCPKCGMTLVKQEKKLPASGDTLKTSFVCMVNNTYMDKEQIPVKVDGKTYYGCCMGCVDNLKNNRAVRYAIDPTTGKEVDKAVAIITMDKESNKVLYFESKKSLSEYLKKNKN